MDAAQALLEGRGAHRGGGEHVRAGFDVRAVGTGPRQVAMDEPHALEGDPIGERMKSRRAERLEAMDEGVDAGRGSHRPRQTDREFRVGDDDARHHLRVEDDLFLVRVLVENDAGHQSPTSSKSHNGRVCPDMNATTLPASSADPPPNATTPSWSPAR